MAIWLFFGSGALMLLSVLISFYTQKRQRKFKRHIVNGLAILGGAWAVGITLLGIWNTLKMLW